MTQIIRFTPAEIEHLAGQRLIVRKQNRARRGQHHDRSEAAESSRRAAARARRRGTSMIGVLIRLDRSRGGFRRPHARPQKNVSPAPSRKQRPVNPNIS